MSIEGARVLFLLSSFEAGGAELQAARLANDIYERRGCRVAVWALSSSPQEPVRAAIAAGIDVVSGVWLRGDAAAKVASLVRIVGRMRAWAPDVVLPYTITPNLIASTLWRACSARACVWNQRDAGAIAAKHVAVARMASAWVSNSCHAREALARRLRAPRERCFFVPNGVELAPPLASPREWRERLAIGAGRSMVTMIGKVGTPKGQAFLLEVWRTLSPGERPVLVLAGRADIGYQDVADRVRAIGLEDDVRLLGDSRDVAGLLAASDLAVFSSSFAAREGIPNGVLEPMVAGLPVVAVDVPGTREAFPLSSTSWLVAPGDATAFADRLRALLSDPTLRARLGARHRGHVAQSFSSAAMVERTVGVLERVVSRPRAGRTASRSP